MKIACFLVLFSTVFATMMPAQQFEARLGGGLFFHLKQRYGDDPAVPDQFERQGEKPSIASFFENGFGVNLDVCMKFPVSNYFLYPGLMVDYASVPSKDPSEAGVVLGEDLKILTISPVFGRAEYINNEGGQFYVFAGPVFRRYRGETKFAAGELSTGKVKGTYDYNLGIGLRLGVGVEGHMARKVSIGGRLTVDIGKIDRGTAHFKEPGFDTIDLEPTGKEDLWDNRIMLTAHIGYLKDFAGARRVDPREDR